MKSSWASMNEDSTVSWTFGQVQELKISALFGLGSEAGVSVDGTGRRPQGRRGATPLNALTDSTWRVNDRGLTSARRRDGVQCHAIGPLTREPDAVSGRVLE